MDLKAFGKRIRALRQEQALTQAAAGREMGVTGGYLGDLERGTRSPSVDTCLAICRAYGVDPNTVFGWKKLTPADMKKTAQLVELARQMVES